MTWTITVWHTRPVTAQVLIRGSDARASIRSVSSHALPKSRPASCIENLCICMTLGSHRSASRACVVRRDHPTSCIHNYALLSPTRIHLQPRTKSEANVALCEESIAHVSQSTRKGRQRLREVNGYLSVLVPCYTAATACIIAAIGFPFEAAEDSCYVAQDPGRSRHERCWYEKH